jgi:hypothetical protein
LIYNFSVMKFFSLIFLLLIAKSIFASLDVTGFNDDQICMFAKDPPLPAQITYEINARGIECNDGVANKINESLVSKGSSRLNKFRRWNKMLRGKGPIYSTRSGANLKIDTFGEEKSITIDKSF